MKFKVEQFVVLEDSKVMELVDVFEEELTDAICEIEDRQIQPIMDLIGGVFPTIEDDEVMETAFDLVHQVQAKIWFLTMERRFNLLRAK